MLSRGKDSHDARSKSCAVESFLDTNDQVPGAKGGYEIVKSPNLSLIYNTAYLRLAILIMCYVNYTTVATV